MAIVVPIVSERMEGAIDKIPEASKYADMLELRIDYMPKINSSSLHALIEKSDVPLIVTNRSIGEGGHFKGTEEKRLALLRRAVDQGVKYVDVEFSADYQNIMRYRDTLGSPTRVIVSSHNFEETPEDPESRIKKIMETGCDVAKYVTFAKSLQDSARILEAIRETSGKGTGLVCNAMGEFGEVTRILNVLNGGLWTYATSDVGEESAPGQIPSKVLREIYDVGRLKPGFKLCGLVGDPVKHSKSFLVHNTLFRENGVNALYVNFLTKDLEDLSRSFLGGLWGGAVTMPHKQGIIPCLQRSDSLSTRVGAVNNFFRDDRGLIGTNTDISGAMNAIERVTSIEGKKVTILGAGGASRALGYGVIDRGGRLTILNRTQSKAEDLARELGCGHGSLEEALDADIIINGTPVGMTPNVDQIPIDPSKLNGQVVLDAIYSPEKTLLLQEAEKRGCKTISGVEMFSNLLAEQFKMWTGLDTTPEHIKEIIARGV